MFNERMIQYVERIGLVVGILFFGNGFGWGASEDMGSFGLQGLPIPSDAVRFVDGVRCGDPNDPHKVVDYGIPSKTETVLGRPARVAGGAWEVFGYTLNIQNPVKPHVLVVTYPDDAYRRVHFRLSGATKGYQPLRSAVNTIYATYYKVNTNAWAKFWTPLYIPGGTGNQVNILFADSRKARNLAPNHEGPKEAQPWAVGEIILYEATDPAKLLPPLAIAHPVKPEEERYFGFTELGYAGNYFRDEANKDYLKRYLRYIGVNFLRFAGGQGGPAYGRPEFDNQLSLLDEMGLRTSFAFFKYFNAFLRDRLKSNTLPRDLIETMPKPIKEAIVSLDGWRKPDNLYEGGSYQAKLMVMPLNWLGPEMGPWLAKLVQYYLTPAAKHTAVCAVEFFGTGDDRTKLPSAIEAFTKAVKSVRSDLMVEVPQLYMHLRSRELAGKPVPYEFDYRTPFIPPNAKGEIGVQDRVGIYDGWPESMKGVVGGLSGSLWRGFHLPPPSLAILDSKEALASVRRFEDGWIAQFRICEQNESESPKGIGWINDYYPWSGAAYRVNILKMMAANSRYVVLNMGHEGSCGQEANLRMLAGAWRAFPWGKVDDLSATLAPKGSKLTALRCRDRYLLINHDPLQRAVSLPAASGEIVDAVTGEALKGGAVSLAPFEARTVLHK